MKGVQQLSYLRQPKEAKPSGENKVAQSLHILHSDGGTADREANTRKVGDTALPCVLEEPAQASEHCSSPMLAWI